MKKFLYSPGGKGALIILQQVLVGIMAVSLCVGLVWIRTNGLEDGGIPREYTESQSFSMDFLSDVYEVINYVDDCDRFETNGVYDPKKIVDIEDYVKTGKISGTETLSVGYYLEDLVKWGQFGVDIESTDMDVPPNNSVPGSSEQAEEIFEEGGLSEVPLDMDSQSQTEYHLQELYTPVHYESIEDYLKQNPDKNPKAIYECLQQAAQSISDSITGYKWNAGRFQEDKSNIRFVILNHTAGTFYTNMSSVTDVGLAEAAVEKIKELGGYYYFDSSSLEFERKPETKKSILFHNPGPSVNGWSYMEMRTEMENLYRSLNQMNTLEGGDYTMVVGIDTTFPYDDAYLEAASHYNELMPQYQKMWMIGAAAILLYLIILVMLTVAAGRRNREEEIIHLNGFDRIPLELVVLGSFAVVWGILLCFTLGIEMSRSLEPMLIFVAIASSVSLNLLLMACYLSIVRRVKSQTVWKNSILGGLFRVCGAGFKGMNRNLRTLCIYGIYLVINFILVCLLNREPAFILLIGLIFNVVVGLLILRVENQRKKIIEGICRIRDGETNYKLDLTGLKGDELLMAKAVNNIGDGLEAAVEASMKNERLKTDLITNVSHDIKTPLTSIINYVNLLKRENIQDEKIREYIRILDEKSQRLKHLTEDLVEASKVSSGNINLNLENLNFVELIHQTTGEFEEKFGMKELEVLEGLPGNPVIIRADGRRLWRVLENLCNNVAKYAMPGTRVYADLSVSNGRAEFSIKNISEHPLNIRADELTERFIRGDVSRSTEGSGLGLSIAKNLTELQGGEFEIYLDGDLFRVTIRFPLVKGQSGGSGNQSVSEENSQEQPETHTKSDERAEPPAVSEDGSTNSREEDDLSNTEPSK